MAIAPIPRDDAGIRRLQESNAARATGAVTPVSPTPRIEERAAEPAAPVGNTAKQDRRLNDRRYDQRRQARRHVLLDTRDKQERRRKERRGRAMRSRRHKTGLDLYA